MRVEAIGPGEIPEHLQPGCQSIHWPHLEDGMHQFANCVTSDYSCAYTLPFLGFHSLVIVELGLRHALRHSPQLQLLTWEAVPSVLTRRRGCFLAVIPAHTIDNAYQILLSLASPMAKKVWPHRIASAPALLVGQCSIFAAYSLQRLIAFAP